jgi:hypothetical protein
MLQLPVCKFGRFGFAHNCNIRCQIWSDVTIARMWYTYVGTYTAMLYAQTFAVPVILRAVGVAVGSLLPRAPVVQ